MGALWGGCSEFHQDQGPSCWIWILSFGVQLGWRVGYNSRYCQRWILFCSFPLWVKLTWVIFCRRNLSKIFCNQVGYVLFICSFCVSLREVIYWFVGVFICYFLYEVLNFFWICIRIYLRKEGSPGGSFSFFDDASGFCPLLFVFV